MTGSEKPRREATIARFDRQATGASSSRVSLEAATNELKSFVERHVQEILRTAVENAARIEREATDRAQKVEEAAERKSKEMLEEAFKHARRILEEMMEGLAGDLGIATPARKRLESTRTNGAGSHAEVEQMITEQVAILFSEGRSRADAEHLVMRFKQGEDYLHVVGEIYEGSGEDLPSPGPPPAPSHHIRWGFRPRRG